MLARDRNAGRAAAKWRARHPTLLAEETVDGAFMVQKSIPELTIVQLYLIA